MRSQTRVVDRKKAQALIAGLIQPGLGQVYNGELAKGLCFFALFLVALIGEMRIVMVFPSSALSLCMALVMLAAIAVSVAFAVEAWSFASAKGGGYMLKWYNRWYVYVALWALCSLFVMGAAFLYVSDNILQSCRVVSASALPSVLPGDLVFVDKTWYKHNPPRRRDVILCRYPDDKSRLYVKLIGGLPGDTVRLESGVFVVPQGHVFTLGDSAGHSDNSRHGPIPLTEVLGKARQIYFSFGRKEGIRWERVGIGLP
jgi:signal peptidase I